MSLASNSLPPLAPSFSPPAAWTDPRRLGKLTWLPLLLVAVLLLADYAFGLDQRLADALYALEGQRWALRDAFATEVLVHRMGRDFSLLLWAMALAAWLAALLDPRGRRWRRPLAYLLLATLLSTLLVSWVKSWSNMDCPWDLLRYGGSKPFIGLLELRPVGLQRGVCFPAAHASSGYAWLALFFFLGVVQPKWRGWGLAMALAAGLVFGLSQQLRGAHFLSHDLWTFAICWATAAGLYRLFWPAREAVVATQRPERAGE